MPSANPPRPPQNRPDASATPPEFPGQHVLEVFAASRHEVFLSDLPSAEELKALEEVYPGAAQQIFEDARRNQEHRMALEKQIAEALIAESEREATLRHLAQEAQIEHAQRVHQELVKDQQRRTWLGASALLLAFAGAVFFALRGDRPVAVAFLAGPLLTVIVAILNSGKNHEEISGKKEG